MKRLTAVCALGLLTLVGAGHRSSLPVVYHSERYGLTFRLPESWRGYSVRVERWREDAESDGRRRRHGPMIVFRHPGWKASDPYHDIPVLVFPRREWVARHGEYDLYAGGMFFELTHNDKYVFATHSRFNTDDETKGADEVGKIVAANRVASRTHPLFDQ
jgi:hypothetical protein